MAEPARKMTPEEVAHSIFQMTPGELETLEILLDKKFSKELLASWKSQKITTFEEIVGRKPCGK
jgi:vacuolar-type H+-ATPase subunit C/Vma6